MSTTSTLNQIKVMSQSEFDNNVSSTDNANLYFVEATFDGQFVESWTTLANTSGSISGTQYSLSSYLPNDGNKYMVKFRIAGYDNDSTFGYWITTDLWTNGNHTGSAAGNLEDGYQLLYGGTYARQVITIVDLPVGTGRYVKLYGGGADNIYLYAIGYRRIGTV